MILAALLFSVPASAQRVGVVKSTDIVTFIDGSPIESYNYNGNTYIEAESLAAYGFDVEWKPDERRLDISRRERAFAPFVPWEINEKKEGRVLFEPVYDVYATDIVTYINGEAAGGINVGGRTLVSNDYMELFGDCVYDNNSRTYSIDIIGREIADCEEKTSAQGDESIIERGFFDDNGYLAYGIRQRQWADKYGSYSITDVGNFAEKKQLCVTDNFKRNDRVMYDFVTNESRICLVADGDFRYGIRIVSAHAESEDSYCGADGRLCAVVGAEYATLYKDGARVCFGSARPDTLKINFIDNYDEYNVLYMPGYSDADGVIYYIPSDDYRPMRAFWRGAVVNGVAHGLGTAYADFDGGITAEDYYLDDPTDGKMRTAVSDNVLACGSFQNGLPDGTAEAYRYGVVRYIGEYKNGRRHGEGKEFSSVHGGVVWVIYAGQLADGKRDGYGTEFAESYSDGDRDKLVRFTGVWKDGNPYSGTLFDGGEPVGKYTDGVYTDE